MTKDVNGARNGQHRRVLMICCAFPPTGGAGVQRSAKFAKFLPRFGWKPIVWSCRHIATLPRDDSLLAELPPDLDHRAQTNWDTSSWPTRTGELAAATARLFGQGSTRADGVRWRANRLMRGLVDCIVPDEQGLWALGSLGTLRRVVLRERIDVIYSTHSPPSNHLLAWRLKLATRVPWVSDYRDLWTDDCWYPFTDGPRWRRAADRFLETRFLRDADAVVAVSPDQTRILADRVPTESHKFVTVTNGADLDDFAGIDRPSARLTVGYDVGHNDRFILAHVGRFTAERVTPEMVQGFAKLVDWLRVRKNQFELRIVGWMSEQVHRQLRATGIHFTATGYVSHDRAVREMVAADALLLQYPTKRNADTAISGKLFEYFAARRPILVIAPANSATRKLTLACEAGTAADPDSDSVCVALRALWELWRSAALGDGCPPEHLARYTRRHVTGELARVLNTVHERAERVRATTLGA